MYLMKLYYIINIKIIFQFMFLYICVLSSQDILYIYVLNSIIYTILYQYNKNNIVYYIQNTL